MAEITAIEPIAQAPASIRVTGPIRGRYNFLGNEETDRYTVHIGDITSSTTVSIETSDEIVDLNWSDKIAAIAEDAKHWISSGDIDARWAAIREWINRDDPEDERLIAIEAAQLEHDAQAAVRVIRGLWQSTQARVVELLTEAKA